MKRFLLQIGCDHSKNLVDICGEKNFQAFVGDALSVPMRSGSCDACISIAVIHHFSTAVSRPPVLHRTAVLLCTATNGIKICWFGLMGAQGKNKWGESED